MKKVMQLEQRFLKKHTPEFRAGDTLKVHVKIKEGDKERVQMFQGIVIGRHGSGTGATFTVRKMSQGIGVERVFPLHSPNIEKIECIKTGSVRRAKLNYLRDLAGKSARIKEKMVESGLITEEFLEESTDAGRPAEETMKIDAAKAVAEENAEEAKEEAKAAKE
jgi:large subunit ribosomal protein L19